jgi:hypothetical protein
MQANLSLFARPQLAQVWLNRPYPIDAPAATLNLVNVNHTLDYCLNKPIF